MKELSKEFYAQIKKIEVPDGMVGVPYLTPTDRDAFKEEQIEYDVYRITIDRSFAVVEISASEKEVAMSIRDSGCQSDYYQAKLMGYIFFKIMPRYNGVSK